MLIYPKIINNLIIILILFGVAACASKKDTSKNSVFQDTKPQLLFLNYNIKKDSKNNKTVKFINKIIADGKLKINSNKYIENGVSGDLQCHQLDKNSNIIQSIIIKNPLKKSIESLNDSLSFQTKNIELNSASFSLKLKLEPDAKYISIHEISTLTNASNPLIKTKLY